jgi:hypothetical protein
LRAKTYKSTNPKFTQNHIYRFELRGFIALEARRPL